ncbi:MAG TPA: DUF4160 domain-containing protein [Verrucomicrobiota bacterium]|nr:DUF4160 domain-containing protein [Verrucomicrobiota bacterium]
MPELSRFLGVVIAMYYREHAPAHFHALYGEYEITVEIETGVVRGEFPRRALRHVLEWYEAHREELRANWELACERRPLRPIEPLE